jgi:rhodanese-related sulfurtransferase
MEPGEAGRRRAELFILHVRSQPEWEAGHIPGSKHISVARLPGVLDEIVPDGRPILVVCQVGYPSDMAARYLTAKGLDAHNLDGGLQAWLDAGLSLALSNGAPGALIDPVWDDLPG